jgi:hypothetical protein
MIGHSTGRRLRRYPKVIKKPVLLAVPVQSDVDANHLLIEAYEAAGRKNRSSAKHKTHKGGKKNG